MGGVFSKIQQDPFTAIKLKQEEEKLKHLQAEIEAKKKIIDVETEAKVKEIKEQSAERIKQFALETKAKDVTLQKLGAEASEQMNNVRLKYFRYGVRYGLPLVAGLLLAADYYYHDYEPYIHKRMKSTILNFHRHQKMQRIPPVYFPPRPSDDPLIPDPIPTLFLGPTGSGKSTLLASIIREYLDKKQTYENAVAISLPSHLRPADPAPVILISPRDARQEKIGDDDKVETTEETVKKKSQESALFRMNKIASQVFDQIGFPSRKPLISYIKFLPHLFGFLSDAKVQYDLEVQTKTRFTFALKCLFAVCVEIRNDRFNTGKYTEEEAAVTLLLDEVHDLVKDSKLKKIGGKDIFAYLAEFLVSYGVNAGYIRSVIAGSSGQLIKDVEGFAIGDRFTVHYLYDPDLAVVKAKLIEKGYTEEESNKITNVCGARLRILQKPLKRKLNVDEFIKRTTGIMQRRFDILFDNIASDDDKKQMIKLLDSIYNNDVVKWSSVPTAVQKLDLDFYTKVLYTDTDNCVQFQSQVARIVWSTIDKEHLTNPKELR